MMWIRAESFTLSRTRSYSSSPMGRPCRRRRPPSSSCCFLLARHSLLADSIRGLGMMTLALRHEKGSFLQKPESMLPVCIVSTCACRADRETAFGHVINVPSGSWTSYD